MNAPLNSGVKNASVIYSKKHTASENPLTIEVPQNAERHQVAIEALDGTAGTAAITAKPVGLVSEVPIYEADGSTPVVLQMVNGDARADIRGSIEQITATLSAFDGTEYKISVTSYF